MTTLELTLSDEIAGKARAAGLLNSAAIENLLREQLSKQAGQELRVMLDKIDALGIPPMTEDEVQAEIEVSRAERRAQNAATG